MPRTKKPAVTKPRITVTTVSFTPAEATVLHGMREEATDRIGRKISSSAVLRALVQWVRRQQPDFARTEIIPLIEKELALLRWGRTKES